MEIQNQKLERNCNVCDPTGKMDFSADDDDKIGGNSSFGTKYDTSKMSFIRKLYLLRRSTIFCCPDVVVDIEMTC